MCNALQAKAAFPNGKAAFLPNMQNSGPVQLAQAELVDVRLLVFRKFLDKVSYVVQTGRVRPSPLDLLDRIQHLVT